MGKWCLHASLFIFDRIIIKVAVNQDRRKSSVKLDFGRNQTTHFGVTCPRVTKISHFWTWISLKSVGQSWSNFMCSIIGDGERLHKVLGQVDLGTLDSGERSLPFGLLVINLNLCHLLCFFLSGSTLWKLYHSNPNQLNFRYRNIRDIPPSVWRYNETPFEILYLCEQNVTWSGNAVFCETSCRLSRHR